MPGKLQPDVLKNSVLQYHGAARPDLITGGGIGEDAALIRVPEGILVVASDPIVGAEEHSGSLLVHVNANDVACKGADPAWFVVTLIIPENDGLDAIKRIMREIHETCLKMNTAVVGGHTEFTNKYDFPVISGTMLGITNYELNISKIKLHDEILVTGHIGMEGMCILANDRADLLDKIFAPDEINFIRSWSNNLSVVPAAKILREFSSYMHDPTEGGLNGALSEISTGANLGIELYDDAIPVSDLTRKAAKELNFEPMNLISSGMLIAVMSHDKIKSAQDKLNTAGIKSSVIGKFSDKNTISNDAHEELWKILARKKV